MFASPKRRHATLKDIVVNVAEPALLERALRRQMRPPDLRGAVSLGSVLKEILSWANRFVPSHSGSVLIDDPLSASEVRDLCFLACFGEGSESIVGARLDGSKGIAGDTYVNGRPYISEDVSKDGKFFSGMDEKTNFETRSIICAPIHVEGRIIGVIELLNRIGRPSYDNNDLVLLEIFAGYTGTLIENALSARMFEELSKRDNLTGLYNDRHFFHCLRFEVGRARQCGGDVSLVFFDLDHFKSINDTHGHMAGSGVLKEIAVILNSVYTDPETIMARYGGDEYVVVLPGIGIDEATALAGLMRAAIEDFTFLSDGDNPLCISGVITCSVGVASLLENLLVEGTADELADELIRVADRAMYRSKDDGKNRVTRSAELIR